MLQLMILQVSHNTYKRKKITLGKTTNIGSDTKDTGAWPKLRTAKFVQINTQRPHPLAVLSPDF